MPNLTPDSYAKLQDLLKDPSLSEGTRQRATAAIETFEAQQAPVEQVPMGPPPPPPVGLDPNLPLVPQALATLPATNHPGGDQAASSEWMSAGPGSAENAVFAYEPPLAVAQKKLLENPELLRSFGFEHILPTPEELAKITTDSPEYQAFADYEWNRVSSEASKAGRKAYRYSKAPWLQSGGAMSAIETLGMKARGAATPIMNGIDSFIMGMDDTVTLGAGAAMERMAGSELPEGADVNSPMANPAERQEHLQEEHPVMNIIGRITGLAAPWGAGGMVYGGLSKAGKALAGPTAGLAKRVGAAALAGGGAETALETGRIGVETGAAAVGDTEEPTPEQAQQRVATAGLVGGALGGGAEALGSGLKAGAGFVVDQVGARYGQQVAGVLDKVAEAGGKFSLLKGIKLSPQTEALVARARGEGVAPTDILAQDIAPQIKEAARREVVEKKQIVSRVDQEFQATREGRQLLPSKNLVTKALDILDRKMDAPSGKPGGKLQTVDVSTAPQRVKRILNNEIADVSVKQAPGGIPISPEKAEAVLSASWSGRLRRKSGKTPTTNRAAEPAQAVDPTPLSGWKPDSDKAYISDLYESTKGAFKSRADFDEALIKFHRDTKGGALNRLDLAGAADKGKMGASRVGNDRVEYHLVGIKDAERFARAHGGQGPAAKPQSPLPEEKAFTGSLATELRKRGIDQVYVFPRRHNARSHEEAIKGINGFGKENPTTRELAELDYAARLDRDERTMNGVRGAWSALQNENSKLIGAAKDMERLVAPKNAGQRDAFPALSQHAVQRRGDLPKVQALRQAAARAGGEVPDTLSRIRMLDPLTQLRNVANYGPTRANSNRGMFSANQEAAAIRAYPALKAGGNMQGLRGGQGGRLSTLAGNPMAIELEEEK